MEGADSDVCHFLGSLARSRRASKAFRRLALKAGLGNWHMHELRHSTASLMLAQGCRLEEVSEIIRHASIRVTKDVYGHLSGERLREATDKMGEFLGDL
ncbi:MAG: tyrosine-type recombinase/integrase [Ferrimicrobium sp.]|jgi:site-specific recombinase XerD|nr:tyrosine-type recombinase/integrase [Ferrimicrobium sp.]